MNVQERYEDARCRRDARFDGHFVVAVRSTGIFCRPSCPARLPLARNVDLLPSAAAAHAGFRPCWRCRPEAAPAPPLWQAGDPAVRTFRRIGAGYRWCAGDAEAEPEERRLLASLGAPTSQVVTWRRMELAANLLRHSQATIEDIAEACRFGSASELAIVFEDFFRRPVDSVRRPRVSGPGWRLRLDYRPPYDWRSLVAFLALRAVAGVEQVTLAAYRRAIMEGDAIGWIEARPVADKPCIEVDIVFPDAKAIPRILQRVRTLFDLDADPMEIGEHLSRVPALAPLVMRNPGLRVPGAWDGFELGVRAILGQQVSVVGATTLVSRMAARLGRPMPPDRCGGLARTFPTAMVVVSEGVAGLGLTTGRARTMAEFAQQVANGGVRPDYDLTGETLKSDLSALFGIGPWTANYIAMRLGDRDAFPASDLGLLNSPALPGAPLTAKELEARSEAWRPWRSYAAMHLWSAYKPRDASQGRKSA